MIPFWETAPLHFHSACFELNSYNNKEKLFSLCNIQADKSG